MSKISHTLFDPLESVLCTFFLVCFGTFYDAFLFFERRTNIDCSVICVWPELDPWTRISSKVSFSSVITQRPYFDPFSSSSSSIFTFFEFFFEIF